MSVGTARLRVKSERRNTFACREVSEYFLPGRAADPGFDAHGRCKHDTERTWSIQSPSRCLPQPSLEGIDPRHFPADTVIL